MRKMFWCGCAIAVTVASLVYLAADYANQNPESAVGRCVLTAYRVSCGLSPITMIGRSAACRNSQQAQQPATEMTAGAASGMEGGAEEASPEAMPCEIIDLTKFQSIDPPQIENLGLEDAYRTEGAPVMVPPTVTEGEQGFETIPPSSETENVPAEIPPAADDDDPQPGTEEQQEPEQIPMPKQEAPQGQSLLFGVGVNSDDRVTGGIEIDDQGSVGENGKEPPVQAVPEGSHEESEAGTAGDPPSCKEDPNYPQHYPSCPYMGGCPSSSHCSPAVSSEPAPAPKKHKKKKVKDSEPMPEKTAPMGEPQVDEECPKHVDLDTMEYRKSDARQGEFRRSPF